MTVGRLIVHIGHQLASGASASMIPFLAVRIANTKGGVPSTWQALLGIRYKEGSCHGEDHSTNKSPHLSWLVSFWLSCHILASLPASHPEAK